MNAPKRLPGALALGLLTLILASQNLRAQDYVNNFNTAADAKSWIQWWGPPDITLTWDSTQDVNNDPASGSLRYDVPFSGAAGDQFMTFGTFANQHPWDDSVVLDGRKYSKMSVRIRIDPVSEPTIWNHYGNFEIGVVRKGWDVLYLPAITIWTEDTWVTLEVPLDPLAPGMDQLVGVYVKLWSGGAFQSPLVLNVDEVRLHEQLLTPDNGEMFARPDTIVSAGFEDSTPIDPASVKFYLNSELVSATATRDGNRVTITHVPPRLLDQGWYYVYVEWNAGSAWWYFRVPPYRAPNGNVFEFVRGSYTWPEAKVLAENRTLAGRKGHLATITTHEEFWFIDAIRWDFYYSANIWEFWLGASQSADGSEPAGGWFWVNGDGPVDPEGWNYGQPDDWRTGEDYMTWPWWGWWNDAGEGNGAQPAFLVEYESTSLKIDIKPDDVSNSFNLDSSGKTSVAILSTATLNTTKLKRDSIRFGPAEASPVKVDVADVNKDKRPDLVCTFLTQDIGLNCGDKTASLTAIDDQRWPATGTDSVNILLCPVYQLTIGGMVDAAGLADISVQVTSLTENCALPAQISLLGLKSEDGLGETRWNSVIHNLALQPVGWNVSAGTFQATGLAAHAPIDAKADIVSCRSGNNVVVRAAGSLLKAPDLYIQTVPEAERYLQNVFVNIPVEIGEFQGDLSGSGRVRLYEGDRLLSTAESVDVYLGWPASVVFTTSFQELGTHHLRVVVDQVSPREYDASNNEKSFTIEVVPAFYGASYFREASLSQSHSGQPGWWSYFSHNSSEWEYGYQALSIPGLQFPIQSLHCAISVDGTPTLDWSAQNILPQVGDVPYGLAAFDLGDGFSLYVQSSPPEAGGGAVQMYKYAGKSVSYSGEYLETWRDVAWKYEQGSLLNPAPQSTIGFSLSVQTQGQTYSSTPTLDVLHHKWGNSGSHVDSESGYFYNWEYSYETWTTTPYYEAVYPK